VIGRAQSASRWQLMPQVDIHAEFVMPGRPHPVSMRPHPVSMRVRPAILPNSVAGGTGYATLPLPWRC
jgi:hypothetical protein